MTPREVALLWLNDHCGGDVNVTAAIDGEWGNVTLLEIQGVLRHWRDEGSEAMWWKSHPRDDISGLYYVGDAGLDFTEIPDTAVVEPRAHGRWPGLAVECGDGIYLRITSISTPTLPTDEVAR